MGQEQGEKGVVIGREGSGNRERRMWKQGRGCK